MIIQKNFLKNVFLFMALSIPLIILWGEAKVSSIKLGKGFLSVNSTYYEDLQVVDKPMVYDNGILFTFYGEKDDEVFLSGDFNEWQKKIPMHKNPKGVFYYFLTAPLKKGDYAYRYLVNGTWINDQEQPFFKVDIHNQRVSYFRLPHDIMFTVPTSPESLGGGKYRFYLKDNGYKKVSLISDDNYWDPIFTLMKLKNGYWYVDRYLGNKKLLYAYWVDGERMFDPLNFSRRLTKFNFPVNYFAPKSSN